MRFSAAAFSTSLVDGWQVVAVTGDLDLTSSSRLLNEFTAAAKSAEPGFGVVVDLSGVEFIDSSALRDVLACAQLAAQAGVTWRLVISSAVQRTLDLAGVGPEHLPFSRVAD